MTVGDTEVLGTEERRAPNTLLRIVVVAVLVVAGVVVLTRGGSHHRPTTAAPPAPTRSPAPSIALLPEDEYDAIAHPHVANVDGVAVVLSHTTGEPLNGLVTTLDGPPGESPLTFTTDGVIPVAAAGIGSIGWFAERTVAPLDGEGTGTLEARDLHSGHVVESFALPDVPQSIAVTDRAVWVGLFGEVVEVDTRTHAERVHAMDPGDIVALVPSPDGSHLYGAIDGPGPARVVGWAVPGLTATATHVLPRATAVTNIALSAGGLWISWSSGNGPDRVTRLDPTSLAPASSEPLDHLAAPGTVHSGKGELWLLNRDGVLRCARSTAHGTVLGPVTRVPSFPAGGDAPGALAAVADRVYVVSGGGTIAYERNVVCP
ncbi:MAG TPA: hypothetical protein VHE83_02260 [Mycobacteriales bacterium]|nr:hypothetical protein [Mycobacteriales bacterium]